jgi:hypothetical protein
MTTTGTAKIIPPAKPVKPSSKKDRLRALLKRNPGITTQAAMREIGCVDSMVRTIRTEMGISPPPNPGCQRKTPAPAANQPKPHVTIETDTDKAIASSLSSRIHTVDQLLRATKVDLALWEVERHTINKWEVAMREPATTVGGAGDAAVVSESRDGALSTLWTRGSNKPIVEPLIQIKVWLKRRAPQVVGLNAAFEEFLARAQKVRIPPTPVRYRKVNGGCLAELDLFDLHFGKLCWAAETGEDYDVKIAERDFKEAVLRLRDSCLPYGISRFLLPLGNDFLNVDNAARTTTAGTPQDEDGRWQRTFTGGLRLMVWAIDTLLESAPVDVIAVPGNHDFERLYYLAVALSCQYRTTKGVTIDNRPTVRKYVEFGNTLLGFTHSDKELDKNLPLIMAVEMKEAWSRTKFREFHCGHVHHDRQRDFQPLLDHLGVTVRWLRALSAADAWHVGKGYRAHRGSTGFVHHPERGLIAELKFNL